MGKIKKENVIKIFKLFSGRVFSRKIRRKDWIEDGLFTRLIYRIRE